MAKRRADPDSDDNESLHSKRAKTEDSEDEAPPEQRARANTVTNKNKRRVVVADDDDRMDDEAGGEDDVRKGNEEPDDDEFEQENAEKLRAHLESKRKIQGGIADHGVVEAIEMHQFMCHKYLTFNFGPQINFIIGHNGSGKSAVLSAITVALGGKAHSTGRGSGLKSFIREGQGVSEVTISLKNQGDEAYKPAEYGKSIVITRRFTKEGSSSWKIKSKDGRVISTKKDELAAICDHMNIQVDNPMNVLTQDAARQFLSASRPEDKYQFFLRGTQLSQLSDEYDICLENITQTAKVLAQKKEALPDLRAAFNETTARYQEAAKAREQKTKADELKKELAWAHVKGKEIEMEKKIGEAAKAARRLPRVQEAADKAEAEFQAASQEVQKYEDEFKALGDIDHIHEQKQAVQDEIKNNKPLLIELNSDVKRMDNSLKATKKQIEEYQQQINEEARRLAVNTQARHDEVQRNLERARDSVSQAEIALQELLDEKRRLSSQCDATKQEGEAAERRRGELQSKIQECEQMIERCKHREMDALAPYGKNIKQLLEKIAGMRWVGDKPLGPLGVHVKARDPEKWGDLLRNQLGSYLTAFAVTDARDRNTLKKLLVDSGNPQHLIIIYEKDLFDYKSGELPDSYHTVLRALDVSDPYVLRILINQARIERQVLADRRSEGERQLKQLNGGGTAWSLDGFAVRVFPEGGSFSTSLNTRRQNDNMSLLLTGRDTASEVKHYQNKIKDCNNEYQSINETVLRLKAQFTEGRKAIERLQESRAQDAVRRAKIALANLQQEANDELPVGMAGFEAAKMEAEAEKDTLFAQFTEVMTKKNQLDATQAILLKQREEYKKQIDAFHGQRDGVQAKVEAAVAARMEAQNQRKGYQNKLTVEKEAVEAIEAAANVLTIEFQNWTEKAEEYCARVENPRSADVVQRNLESVQAALKKREERQGASVEEMIREVNKAKDCLDKAEKELKQMSMLNKALKSSLITRLSRWQEFRRHIALRCRVVFQYHLSHRGYFGKVLFNHDQGTLNLKVQTDDQSATQGARDKDPRSLSGGEKSFSTICLLLALWESIGCPLRCLDEFDVFMDAVNRRISMKMMIDTANSSDKKQYILITPQDMSNIHTGPTVRVHRMTDPERGNGVLAFRG